MLSLPIRLALVLDMLLIVLEHLIPSSHGVLPLGGDHFIQLGAMVILGVVLTELSAIGKVVFGYLQLGGQWLVGVLSRMLLPPNP